VALESSIQVTPMARATKARRWGPGENDLAALMTPMAATINDQEAATIANWLMTGK